MVKTCFQIKVSVATRTRAMRASQWYQCFEELMKKSTYWSWVAELWNWTSMEQYRAQFLNVIIWLASGKIKEGKLMEKLDWKRLENRFWSCRILSYGTSLAGWFWLSKLEKMNDGWPSIYRETNWSEVETGALSCVIMRGLRIAGGAMSGEKSLPLRVTLDGPVILLMLVPVLNSCFIPCTYTSAP